MKLSQWYYKQILDHLGEAIYFVDRERRIRFWNQEAERLTGYKAEEVIGSCCYDNLLDHVDARMNPLCQAACPLTHAIHTGQVVEERIFLRQHDGQRLPVKVKVAPVRDRKGEIIGAVEIFSDATANVRVEQLTQELQQLVNVDPLTQLPNRRGVVKALEREVQRFRRYGTPFSVIFADIDFFKSINDNLGHAAGDRALAWVAGLLRRILRQVDMVGRFGGEEFIVVLPATPAEAAAVTAEHLREAVSRHPCPDTGSVITISCGVTGFCPDDGLETLLERADAAMYQSKHEGRNRVTRV